MANQAILRIGREVAQIQQGNDLSLAVACQDADIRNVKALIVGPPETPYEFGFFELSIKFGRDYPTAAPHVNATTTNKGRCRFNPNIYSTGKVCLSILGTWRGESGEQWSSAQGLESILISIQSLMSSNPYENEPGFENAKSASDKKNMADYVAKIRHETLRIAVVQRLEESLGIQSDGTVDLPNRVWDEEAEAELDEEDRQLAADLPPFEPFKDLCKRRFLWYYETYYHAISEAEKKVRDGDAFSKMPFEGGGNSMDGYFHYPELKKRLQIVKKTLMHETDCWASEGLSAKRREVGIAANLQRQFEQVVELYKKRSHFNVDFELVNGNPFVWQIVYFGKPMTHLDGGLFKIKVALSPRFPDEQPRVFLQTPLYHHRVSKDGVLCYFPKRSEDMKGHLEAIIEALEEEEPPYDPRTIVHPEASKLFWGSADDKKKYNRSLRRSVQRSNEDS